MGWGSYAQTLLALVFVLALIGLLTVVARRFGFGSPTPTIGHRNKRVHIVEVTQLDTRRRLVLVRRDDCEHLILLGNDREQVIETGIRREAQQNNQQGASFATTLAATVNKTTGATSATGITGESPEGEQT